MRLNCSKKTEHSIKNLSEWIWSLASQTPAEVIRLYPQLASLLPGHKELFCEKTFSQQMWLYLLNDFFILQLVGPHRELMALFPPLEYCRFEKCCFGEYELSSVAGIGSGGCVYRTTAGLCLKISAAPQKENLKQEYHILKELQHENIVKCFDFIEEKHCAGILLEPLIMETGSNDAYFRGVCSCHAKGILHGDLRLNNLGCDLNGRSKIFDFGNAREAVSEEWKMRERELLKSILHSPVAQAQKRLHPRGGVVC